MARMAPIELPYSALHSKGDETFLRRQHQRQGQRGMNKEGQDQGQSQGPGQLEEVGYAKSAEDGEVNVGENGRNEAGTETVVGKSKWYKQREKPATSVKCVCSWSYVVFFVLVACVGGVVYAVSNEVEVDNEQVQQRIRETLNGALKENLEDSLKENAKAKQRVSGVKNSRVEKEAQTQNQTQTQVTKDIYFYSKKNFEGYKHVVLSWLLNENTCYNLDKAGDDFASSMNTQGECVYVFEDSDCRGKKHKFSSETKNQHDLSFLGLDKKISSLQACFKVKD